jgi:hypothetical protein
MSGADLAPKCSRAPPSCRAAQASNAGWGQFAPPLPPELHRSREFLFKVPYNCSFAKSLSYRPKFDHLSLDLEQPKMASRTPNKAEAVMSPRNDTEIPSLPPQNGRTSPKTSTTSAAPSLAPETEPIELRQRNSSSPIGSWLCSEGGYHAQLDSANSLFTPNRPISRVHRSP